MTTSKQAQRKRLAALLKKAPGPQAHKDALLEAFDKRGTRPAVGSYFKPEVVRAFVEAPRRERIAEHVVANQLAALHEREGKRRTKAKSMRDARAAAMTDCTAMIRARVKAKNRPKSKLALFDELRKHFGTRLSLNGFKDAWKDAKVPKTWRAPGVRPARTLPESA